MKNYTVIHLLTYATGNNWNTKTVIMRIKTNDLTKLLSRYLVLYIFEGHPLLEGQSKLESDVVII